MSKYIEIVKKVDYSDIKKLYTDEASLNTGIPEDTREKILQANDFISFIDILKPAHCSSLNFFILIEIAQKVDTISCEVMKLVDQFNQTIYPRKITEAICQISLISMNYYTEIKETWNVDFDDIIIENLIDHQEKLASILKIPKYSLVLQQIKPGVEIQWAIPTRLVDKAVKSTKSVVDLNSYSISKLEIGSQHITVTDDYHPITEEVTG